MTTVNTRGLSLDYDGTPALFDINLSMAAPAIYGLLGRNGSGKTTLLSVLAGFRRQSSGEVLVDGAPVFENQSITSRICLIRESGDTVHDSETVATALEFSGLMRPNWDQAYALALLERFGLPQTKKIKALSRGQRAMLACTLGLASRAPLTMFDETYLGMDAPSRYIFYDALLQDYMAHPRLIVVSTHLIEEISNLFEYVLILEDGALTHAGEAADLRAGGVAVTGEAQAVDRLTKGLEVVSEKRLGPTKSVAVMGQVDDAFHRKAAAEGLEIDALGLQDVFVHLTDKNRKG